MQIGLQMYTLRSESERDFVGTLRKVAAIGYQGVEFAGYGGYEAAELKRLMDEIQLRTAGSHVSYEKLMSDPDTEIAYLKTLDCRNVVVPYLQEEVREGEANWKEVSRYLKMIGERCAQQGMRLLYHNHDFEFREKVEGKPAFDFLYGEVPAELLQIEMDVCWVYYGGYDPLNVMEKYKGRLPIVHFKDMITQADGSAQTVELGAGEIQLDAIKAAAENAGTEWLIVEQDHCQNPPLDSVKTSLDWLKQRI